MQVRIDVGAGELTDKITILEIKADRIDDPAKLYNVRHELQVLRQIRDEVVPTSDSLRALTNRLREVNERLWEIEDEIRQCERERDFGATFVELARAVYRTNDRRAELKRTINTITGSTIVEEKSYAAY